MRKVLAPLPFAFSCTVRAAKEQACSEAAVCIREHVLHTIVCTRAPTACEFTPYFAGGAAPQKPYPVPSPDSIQPYQAPAAPAPPVQEPIRWTQVRLWQHPHSATYVPLASMLGLGSPFFALWL